MTRVASRERLATIGFVILVIFAGCTTSLGPGTGTPSATNPTDTPQPAEGTVEVHFINVGQSVSTLVIGPTGETMLIDTGHYQNDGEYVLQYLQRLEINRIDYLVTSHNDADHIGGNAAVIEYFEKEADGICAVYDPGTAASTNVSLSAASACFSLALALWWAISS